MAGGGGADVVLGIAQVGDQRNFHSAEKLLEVVVDEGIFADAVGDQSHRRGAQQVAEHEFADEVAGGADVHGRWQHRQDYPVGELEQAL